jgi:hypothetical protein
MKRHRFLLYQAIVPGLLFVTMACSQTAPTPHVSSPTAVIRSTPTLPPVLTPTTTPPLLGSVPQNCPSSPAPRNIFPDVGPGYGTSPVWAFGLETTIRIPTSYDSYTQYGWTWKVIWRVSSSYTHLVSLHARNLSRGTPLWFQIGDQAPSTSPVLDALHTAHSSASEASWIEWGSYIYIPMAGCYQIEATWPGGQWSISFAAGS